jgi:hypothetical protein
MPRNKPGSPQKRSRGRRRCWLACGRVRARPETRGTGVHMAGLRFGRDIRHVMLLHLGGFETVMRSRLLELLSRRPFQLISLPQAESDPLQLATLCR